MELKHMYLYLILVHIVCLIRKIQTAKECVYQYDMKHNRVKITCEKGAVLHIVDQNGNTLLTGETSSSTDDSPVVVQLNRSSISSLNDEAHKATKKLSDASKLLRKVREDLTLQINNLINLTSLLQRGDDELKKDLFTLRNHELTSPLVREAIIAALQNQYNFLRMGLLSQNTQMNELIRTTMRLTTSIMKTARGARGVGEILDLRADVMNETLFNITKLMPGGFEHGAFFGEKTVFCPQELKKISKKGTSVTTGVEQGTIMIDSHTPDKIWVMYGYININEVIEYNSLKGLKFEQVDKTYELPFSCVGTGHVVYKQVLYCQKMFTNKIVKYSLAESRWLGERQLDNVGVHDTFPYQSGKHTDLDFAVDEKGLWLIYATNSSRGHIVVSKVNEEDLSFDNTWVTEVKKKTVGNAFIICGVLYAVDAFDKAPTYVKYVFDTNTANGRGLEPGDLPFVNSVSSDYARVYGLDYSPSDQALYSWNNGRIEIYPVSFLDENEP
ncbi:olfactomedin-like protein 2B isoform X3 [Mercenaria mercenaria]|uniref:olfactomedin-like protein 2B isoform X3 n=1 Tax=Mercenaria mercenaria TaxID=6596 RepID=UPI00234EAF2F|nr:olfactomedin-like protein 2B isoform X3 [Mercenaria mercenaria]